MSRKKHSLLHYCSLILIFFFFCVINSYAQVNKSVIEKNNSVANKEVIEKNLPEKNLDDKGVIEKNSDKGVIEKNSVIKITKEPSNLIIAANKENKENKETTLSVTATGTPAPTYQWQVSSDGKTWSNLPESGQYSGVKSNQMRIGNATTGLNGMKFRCVLTNSSGSVTSNVVTVTVK